MTNAPIESGPADLLLDDLQAGHLRRMIDLAERLPDDWSGMMGRTSLQEDFGALRFQLAYMSYALALCHLHRLPAAPAVFRKPFEQLIEKMLSPDVWTYWHYVSTGNGLVNRSLGELPPQWNPVETDNIMYSAYVQSMALLYHCLFDDPKYAQPGALTFHYQPLYWGDGAKTFSYDEKSLNERIYWQMVQNGYLGVACEPNCIFQICNQPAILGFRLHDVLYGGSVADEVTEGYRRAWDEFGILDPNGHFNILVQQHERQLVMPMALPWADFWLGSLMHMWDPAGVAAAYPQQIASWAKRGPDDTMWIEPSIPVGERGQEITHARDFGWAAVCASEVGDAATLTGLLAYADRFLTPTWDDGAFYYKRRDGFLDDDGKLYAMDPHTGNVLLAYARLNVPGGLNKLYMDPQGRDRFEQPALVDMTAGLDVRAAHYDARKARLELILRPGRMIEEAARLIIAGIWSRGAWSLTADGETVVRGDGTDVIGTTGAVQARRVGDRLELLLPMTSEVRLAIAWAA